MLVLVTGATGFVGGAVARHLAAAGHRVRALVRPCSSRGNLSGLDCELAFGDLGDPDSLAMAVKGCEAVFHVAADYRLWVPDPARMMAINVDGTLALMRCAAEAGVRRIVYTSSVATLGLRGDGTPADEDSAATLDDMCGVYKRSKYLAEAEVRRLIAERSLPAVIVMPSAPFGPGDAKPTPTGRIVVDAASGRMPAYVDTGLNVVHVDDVAAGHLLAFERGRIGERYILGGDDMTLKEILTVVTKLAGVAPPRYRVPHGVVLPIAHVVEGLAHLWPGFDPPMTADSVRMARKLMYFSSAKAVRELGYAPRPGRQALRDSLAWFLAHDYIKGGPAGLDLPSDAHGALS
jgi:dihydroflavonol-4-reductase